MRAEALLLLLAVLLLAATGTATAADNTAPLADAGVDQTVPANATVYLDANGSVDPDGEITSVEWTIQTPDGATIPPECVDCRRTEFDATALGQYTVTLTVTDDDGATRSDTLYVTAATEAGPDVSLSGPNSTASGSNTTFTANVTGDDASLQTLTWLVNGSVVERESLAGASSTASFTHTFDSTGDATVRTVVYDTLGERGSATRRVSVSNSGGGGGGDSSGCYATWCGGTGADMRYTVDGTTTITDTNNQEGLQTYRDGDIVTIKNPDENPNIERGLNSEYRVDGGLNSLSDSAFESNEDENGRTGSSGSPTFSDNNSASSIVQDAVDSINSIIGGGGSNDDSGDDDSGGGGGEWLGGGGGGSSNPLGGLL